MQNQILGEDVPLIGMPFGLHYRSDRAPGRLGRRTLEIPLTTDAAPPSLKRIDLKITVGGREFKESFGGAANQMKIFTWDGKNAYGQKVQGDQPVSISVHHVYEAGYRGTPRFGYNGDGTPLISADRTEFSFAQEAEGTLGNLDALSVGLGGWTVGAHHAYDPGAGVLYMGDGRRRSAQNLDSIITTVAGDGANRFNGDGVPATQSSLGRPNGVAFGPDGSMYIADTWNNRVRRVGPDGIIRTVAGNGIQGYSGDGGPAVGAALLGPANIAVDRDGSFYFYDFGNNCVRRVGADGIITTVAGNGTPGYGGDGGPAAQSMLNSPGDVIIGQDSVVYIADKGNRRIRRVGPDGIISTVAGNDTSWPFTGDGGPATQAGLGIPSGLAMDQDGNLFVSEGRIVRRIGKDGIITRVAGKAEGGIPSADGLCALEVTLSGLGGIAFGNGNVFIADWEHYRVWRIGQNGIISTVAGRGENRIFAIGDGGRPRKLISAPPGSPSPPTATFISPIRSITAFGA
jgi:sugar lactone lactonase YvrE